MDKPNTESNKEKSEIYCLDCEKYFKKRLQAYTTVSNLLIITVFDSAGCPFNPTLSLH